MTSGSDIRTYLDFNATAPVRPEAAAAVAECLGLTGNASSVHRFGRAARRVLEDAREEVARATGAEAQEVVFTSSGSEANHLALLGCGRARVLVSAGEHASVLEAEPRATRVALSSDGRVDTRALAAALAAADEPAVVSVMLANNETGVLQPLEEVVARAREAGALIHCDAVQALGKVGVDFRASGVDMMSVSAHKIGGPQGVGALLVREDLPLRPVLRGGGQEKRRRAGTENLPGIAGFGAAARAVRDSGEWPARIGRLRDRMESELRRLAPDVRIFGAEAPRLPNTCCFAVPGLSAETLVIALDLAGVAVSAGSACSSGKVEPSHVIVAMGAGDDAANAVRVSLGWTTEEVDVARFVEAMGRATRRARERPPPASVVADA